MRDSVKNYVPFGIVCVYLSYLLGFLCLPHWFWWTQFCLVMRSLVSSRNNSNGSLVASMGVYLEGSCIHYRLLLGGWSTHCNSSSFTLMPLSTLETVLEAFLSWSIWILALSFLVTLGLTAYLWLVGASQGPFDQTGKAAEDLALISAGICCGFSRAFGVIEFSLTSFQLLVCLMLPLFVSWRILASDSLWWRSHSLSWVHFWCFDKTSSGFLPRRKGT